MKVLLVATMLLAIPAAVSAHPGRTDSSGGHTCRTNCPKWGLSTGEYHTHGSAQAKKITPTTSQKPVAKTADQIRADKILLELNNYRANHSGFREALIERLFVGLGSPSTQGVKDSIAAQVYSLLPDIR